MPIAILLFSIAMFIMAAVFSLFVIVIGFLKKKPDSKEYASGKRDPLQNYGLVFRTPNLIRAVVGFDENEGEIKKIIANVDGEYYDEARDEMVESTSGYDPFAGETTLQMYARKYLSRDIFGTPFFDKIRPVQINRVVERPADPTQKRNLAEQLEANDDVRFGIKGRFPRPTHHADLDTSDSYRFKVNTLALIRTVKPKLVFTRHKDDFLLLIDKAIGTFMKSKILSGTYKDYKDGQKKLQDTQTELNELNDLLCPIGFECYQLTMSDPEVHPDMQAIIEAEARAVENAKAARKTAEGEKDATISKAEGQKKKVILEAEAEAEATRLKAAARATRVKEVFDQIKDGYTDKGEAMAAALAHIEREFMSQAVADHEGPLVFGGSSGFNFNVDPNKTGSKEKK